jgi:hypothetical protein
MKCAPPCTNVEKVKQNVASSQPSSSTRFFIPMPVCARFINNTNHEQLQSLVAAKECFPVSQCGQEKRSTFVPAKEEGRAIDTKSAHYCPSRFGTSKWRIKTSARAQHSYHFQDDNDSGSHDWNEIGCMAAKQGAGALSRQPVLHSKDGFSRDRMEL